MSVSLAVSALSVSYGKRPVVREATLDPIAAGTLTALVGPNAAGKSTFLRALAGLLPARGSVRLGDMDLQALSLGARARHVGFMPQALPQGVGLSVLESVLAALHASPSGANREAIQARALAALRRFGILPLAMEPLDRLSGGQRQLASLAQAAVREPTLLMLDEPTSALDPRHQFRVMGAAHAIARAGRIVLVVLHDLALAARFADRVVVMQEGRIKAQGAPRDALTPSLLRAVYGVEVRVDVMPDGRLALWVEGETAGETAP